MLERFKIARIDSSLRPPISGKPQSPLASPKKSVISGLGDRMRRETEQALERGLKLGMLAAITRFKIARGVAVPIRPFQQDLLFAQHGDMGHAPTPAAPAARSPVSWDAFRSGAAQHVGDAANPAAAAMSPKLTRRSPIAPNLPPPSPASAPVHGAPPPTSIPSSGGGGGMLSRFKLPSVGLKGALGLGALGALGTAAWGMHRQNQADRDANRLVNAPMQGGFY